MGQRLISKIVKRGDMDNPKRVHLPTLRAPGRKGATGAEGAAGRPHEKFQYVFCSLFLGLPSIKVLLAFLAYNTLKRHTTPSAVHGAFNIAS